MTWVIFNDASDSLAIESGQDIYAFVTNIKMGNSNLLTPSTIPLQDWDIVSPETVYDNYERRKPYINYTGMNQNVFQIKAKYSKNIATSEELGKSGTINSAERHLLTPHRLIRMFHSGHKFYMRDPLIWDGLYNDGTEALYTTSGIPVVIKDVSIDTNSIKEGEYVFTITLWEDRYTDG